MEINISQWSSFRRNVRYTPYLVAVNCGILVFRNQGIMLKGEDTSARNRTLSNTDEIEVFSSYFMSKIVLISKYYMLGN